MVDPDQINNVANNPKLAGIVKKLKNQLTDYLKSTNDPRFTDLPVKFKEYPYRSEGYLNKRFKGHGFKID